MSLRGVHIGGNARVQIGDVYAGGQDDTQSILEWLSLLNTMGKAPKKRMRSTRTIPWAGFFETYLSNRWGFWP